jgi:branched-subunit amino acid transport protein
MRVSRITRPFDKLRVLVLSSAKGYVLYQSHVESGENMVELWLLIIAAGLVTFALRVSFIVLWERITVPSWLQRALRFVPVAVLSAIIWPELLVHDGSLPVSPYNLRLLAGLLAAVVAWRTRNVFVTIGVGLVTLIVLQTWLGV